MLKKIAFMLMSLIALPNLFSADQPAVILDGYAQETQLKLFWSVYDWPEDNAGFNVKRRIKGEDEWTSLNKEPVPGLAAFSRAPSRLGLGPLIIYDLEFPDFPLDKVAAS